MKSGDLFQQCRHNQIWFVRFRDSRPNPNTANQTNNKVIYFHFVKMKRKQQQKKSRYRSWLATSDTKLLWINLTSWLNVDQNSTSLSRLNFYNNSTYIYPMRLMSSKIELIKINKPLSGPVVTWAMWSPLDALAQWPILTVSMRCFHGISEGLMRFFFW